jgi:hypothetical protein
MAEYFTANDLRARLNKTACWIHEEAECIAGRVKTEGRIDDCRMVNLSIVAAMWQAAECYTPITSEAEDGVVNCLTEAQQEQLFNNISAVTDLCFVPKCIEWILETEDDDNQSSRVKNTALLDILDQLGDPIKTVGVPAHAADLDIIAQITATQKAASQTDYNGTYKKY